MVGGPYEEPNPETLPFFECLVSSIQTEAQHNKG